MYFVKSAIAVLEGNLVAPNSNSDASAEEKATYDKCLEYFTKAGSIT